MTWQIYLLISILLISCNALFHRSLMKNEQSNPRAQTIVFLGLGGIIAFILAITQGKLQLSIPVNLYLNFILLALLATPAYVLTYKAYQLLGASEVVLFLVTGRLWSMVGAYIFLHEVPTFQKILGALVILVGVAITLYDKRRFKMNLGLVLALLAAFLFGMNDINGFYISKQIDAANLLIFADFLPIIALLTIQPKIIKKLKYYRQKGTAIKAIFLSLCDTVGSLAFILSFQAGGKASVIGPLSATRVIVTVILAMILLKERNNVRNKLFGALVAVCGIVLLL